MTDPNETDEATLEDAFEWVNAWAAQSGTNKGTGQAGQHLAARDDRVASHRSASAEPAHLTELRPSPAFVPRWANRFRIVAREELPAAPDEKNTSIEAAEPDRPDPSPGQDNQHLLDPEQLERDIADIRAARDRLSWEAARKGRKIRQLAAMRTSDCVPILVGGMLAFAALVVFGAAASFVSFR